MINTMQADNSNLKMFVDKLKKDTFEKMNMLNLFEKKLNKWIKEFQGEQDGSRSSFNEVIKKS